MEGVFHLPVAVFGIETGADDLICEVIQIVGGAFLEPVVSGDETYDGLGGHVHYLIVTDNQISLHSRVLEPVGESGVDAGGLSVHGVVVYGIAVVHLKLTAVLIGNVGLLHDNGRADGITQYLHDTGADADFIAAVDLFSQFPAESVEQFVHFGLVLDAGGEEIVDGRLIEGQVVLFPDDVQHHGGDTVTDLLVIVEFLRQNRTEFHGKELYGAVNLAFGLQMGNLLKNPLLVRQTGLRIVVGIELQLVLQGFNLAGLLFIGVESRIQMPEECEYLIGAAGVL